MNRLMEEQERSVAWVARAARISYKRVLGEIKHADRPLKLETALAVAPVLGTSLASLVESSRDVEKVAP